MSFVLSNHVLERALERGIPVSVIQDVLANPAQVVDNNSDEPGQKVYQSVVPFAGKNDYLVRIFVNTAKFPPVVKSVYRTSRISKYYESEI